MRKYRFADNRMGKFLFGVFLFGMLLLARDTLITSSILGFNRSQILMLGLICVMGVVFLVRNRRDLKAIVMDKRMAAAIASTVIVLLPMVFKRDWQMMYFSILICLYFAIFLTYFISYQDVARYYVVILTALGLYSVLALHVLRPLLVDSGRVTLPVFFNQIDVMFHNFGLAFVSDSYVKKRNFGIFREPGVYQYFIIVALFLNNYVLVWRKQRQLWLINGILALTMLTTFATGGVAELIVLAVVVFIDKKLYQDKRAWMAVGAVAVVLIILIAVIVAEERSMYWELYSMIIGKFLPGEESAVERFDAIFTDIDLILHNPIFGAKLSEVLHAVENNTTSTLILYAGLGVFGGTLNVAAWVALVWDKERKLWVNLALLGILFLSFNTQNLIADVFFWLFPCMALVERGLPLLKKRG